MTIAAETCHVLLVATLLLRVAGPRALRNESASPSVLVRGRLKRPNVAVVNTARDDGLRRRDLRASTLVRATLGDIIYDMAVH